MTHSSRTLIRPPRLLALLLSIILLASAPGHTADALTLSDEGYRLEKVADPSTYTSLLESDQSAEDEAVYSTEQAGRIMVDKSVYASAEDAQQLGLDTKLDPGKHGFITSLSAIATSASIRPESDAKHDVIFVVGLPSTLEIAHYNGPTQAEHLVQALNVAMGRLLTEDPDARIGLIGYTYDATVLMPLADYKPDGQGRFLTYTAPASDGEQGQKANTGTIGVVATADGAATSSARFDSGAYLQRALVLAREQLMGGAASAGGGHRDASLIIMGTETPLTASTDFTEAPELSSMQPGEILGPNLSQTNTRFGTDASFATLLTLAHLRNETETAYGEHGGAVRISTVGFQTKDMGAFTLATARERAAMHVAFGNIDLSANFHDAARTYGEAAGQGDATVTLSLAQSVPNGVEIGEVTFATEEGLLESQDRSWVFDDVDAYHLARSGASIRGAFMAAIDSTLGINFEAPAPADDGDSQSTVSRFTARDRLAHGMTVGSIEGIRYRGELLDGSGSAEALVRALNDVTDFEAWREFSHVSVALEQHFGLDTQDALELLTAAKGDGQLSFDAGSGTFSNRATVYLDENQQLVKGADGSPFTFVPSETLKAIENGTWQNAGGAIQSGVEAARGRGAVATSEMHFYVGDYENQYTGQNVDLYDFVIMVETELETGDQELLLSIPAASIPAKLLDVVVAQNGSSTMSIDRDRLDNEPLSLVYEIEPNSTAKDLLDRFEAGQTVELDEVHEVFGESVQPDATGTLRLWASDFEGAGQDAQAQTVTAGFASDTNGYYVFARDTPLYRLRGDVELEPGELPTLDQLVALDRIPNKDEVVYYLKTFYEASFADSASIASAQERTSVMPYVVEYEGDAADSFILDGGVAYVRAGTPKYVVPFLISSHEKHPNATASAPYSELLRIEEYRDVGFAHLSARLGNNGAIVLSPRLKPGSLVISTTAEGEAASDDVAAGLLFPVTITLTDAEGAPLAGEFDAQIEGTGIVGGTEVTDGTARISFADGTATVKLSAPASLSISGLPARAAYTVTGDELSERGYDLDAAEPAGTIDSGEDGTQAQKVTLAYRKNYTAADISIPGAVTLTGRDAQAGEFTFQLFESDGTTPVEVDGEPALATNPSAAAGAEAAFELAAPQATRPGTYDYVVRQIIPDEADEAVDYDQRAHRVRVRVEADEAGVLHVAEITYAVGDAETPADALRFENAWNKDENGGTDEPGGGNGSGGENPDNPGGGNEPGEGNGNPDGTDENGDPDGDDHDNSGASDPDGNLPEDEAPSGFPATGDNSGIIVASLLLGAVISLTAGVLIMRRRR